MGLIIRYRCPKCSRGTTWFERSNGALVQRCVCGLTKYLERRVDGVTILSTAVAQPDVQLPAATTKLYRCLLAIRDSKPNAVSTRAIQVTSGLGAKETPALLVTLRIRGLVERVENRHGVEGGSTWVLTPTCSKLMT